MATSLQNGRTVEGRNQQPTELFGQYRVFEKIGTGGMAVVHRAMKTGIAGFEREVALKRLLPHQAENPRLVEAFVREAKLAARLRHPNIAQTYELGRVGDSYFISMEYVHGRDVRQIMRELARQQVFMPIDVAVAILLELCDALDYAHTRTDDLTNEPLQIVHRDISPSNLIITDGGHLKVIDFGIAKAAPRELATSSGRVKGKFGYMAPEALQGNDPDARSDLFSVGVVAHEILSTRRLFGAHYTYDTIARMHRAEIEPPSARNPAVPPSLDHVVLRALARDVDERWQATEEMRDALYRVALEYRLEATSDRTAHYLAGLFEEPEEPEVEVVEDVWLSSTDVEIIDDVQEFELVESEVGTLLIELPPARPDTAPTGVFDLDELLAGADDEAPSRS